MSMLDGEPADLFYFSDIDIDLITFVPVQLDYHTRYHLLAKTLFP